MQILLHERDQDWTLGLSHGMCEIECLGKTVWLKGGWHT